MSALATMYSAHRKPTGCIPRAILLRMGQALRTTYEQSRELPPILAALMGKLREVAG